MSTITVSNGKQEPQGPSRLTILKTIFEELCSLHTARSWVEPNSCKRIAEHAVSAESLMCLLEAHDCGSHGGFDRECAQSGTLTFIERFIWLVHKYGHENDLGSAHAGTSFKKLLEWFPPNKPITRVGEPITKKKSKIGAARG